MKLIFTNEVGERTEIGEGDHSETLKNSARSHYLESDMDDNLLVWVSNVRPSMNFAETLPLICRLDNGCSYQIIE